MKNHDVIEIVMPTSGEVVNPLAAWWMIVDQLRIDALQTRLNAAHVVFYVQRNINGGNHE